MLECLTRDPRVPGFEPHRRHCVVGLEQDTFILASKTCPCLTERLLMGPKESNRTNKQKRYIFVRLYLSLVLNPTGLPRSGEKFWKMKNFPGHGKVRELHFQSGKFKKNEKSHGKVWEYQNFSTKMLVNRLLEILVSRICKQI